MYYNLETNIDITAQNVVKLLSNAGLRAATAESCTGGLISAAITSVGGSSDVFDLGICTYANSAKSRFLAVPEEMLSKYGAVSESVAIAMCRGIQRAADSDFGLSVTGIAGPSGGTAEKPVGTVFIGLSTRTEAFAERFLFKTDGCPENMSERNFIRMQTVKAALSMLEKKLKP